MNRLLAPAAPTAPQPDRRRMFLSAIGGSGLLTAAYWTFPPIFAEADPAVLRGSLVGGVKVASIPTDVLPSDLAKLDAHRRSIELLEDGVRRLRDLGGYTAKFTKRELVGGSLGDAQAAVLKIRHAPFSVYMKWVEGHPGRELLYVDGRNDGEMIIQLGGWRGRMLGPLKLNPVGSTAMSESRHPVTDAGMLRLAEIILRDRYAEAALGRGYRCVESAGEVDGRPCYVFATEYETPEIQDGYRKAVVYVDKEWNVPTRVQAYGWPSGPTAADKVDAETLIEDYAYADIDFGTELAAVDFDTANREYKLRRK